MLQLARKKNQSVMVQWPSGEVLEIKILAIRPSQVTLGFRNEEGLKVFRAEVFKKKESEKYYPEPNAPQSDGNASYRAMLGLK